MNLTRLFVSTACASIALATLVHAEVTLPAVISDNMVLQKGKANVWGKAEPKEKVTIKLAGKTATATAGEDGAWSAKLDVPKAGGPFEMTVEGKNSITIKNVVVGEVWVASGQSNMEFTMGGVKDAAKEVEEAKFPMIRMFTVTKKVADEPQSDCKGRWEVCAPEAVRGFSAVGYFFARDLNRKLKVPVGVIHTSWGGTPAESWTPKATLEADEELKLINERWGKFAENFAKAKEDAEKKLAQWKEQAAKDKADGKPGKPAPRVPQSPDSNPNKPSGLYNGMIAPIVPYTVRGAIWYQGESNAGRALEYRKLFPAMIQSWRKAWGTDLPFGFVQLANFMARKPEPADSAWAMLREAQTMTLKLPKTGMAVIIDIGEEKDIHPKNKQDVGKRLALWAEANVYDQGETFSGPMFSSMKVSGDKATITFKNSGGLVAKDGPLKGFAIAGEDMKFAWADAKIAGANVVVTNPSMPKPVAVRYAWADNPECNLYNKAGLPASPFRTDNWEHTMALVVPVTKPAPQPEKPSAAANEAKQLKEEVKAGLENVKESLIKEVDSAKSLLEKPALENNSEKNLLGK